MRIHCRRIQSLENTENYYNFLAEYLIVYDNILAYKENSCQVMMSRSLKYFVKYEI